MRQTFLSNTYISTLIHAVDYNFIFEFILFSDLLQLQFVSKKIKMIMIIIPMIITITAIIIITITIIIMIIKSK